MHNDDKSDRPIVYLTQNIREYKNWEAIKTTMFNLSERLVENHPIQIVSLEEKSQQTFLDNGIYYTNRYSLLDLLKNLNPNLIHLFHSDLWFHELNLLDHFRVIHSISSGNVDINLELQKKVEYYADQGDLLLVCESHRIFNSLEGMGIRCYDIIYPSVDMDVYKMAEQQDNNTNDCFKVGFASSPFVESHWNSRGMPLLLKVASEMKHIDFFLAWREFKYLELMDEIEKKGLDNVHVINGKIRMTEFYNSIDVMIAPFVGLSGNHDSPLSIIEGLSMNKPAIVSEDIGLSDIIEKERVGIKCKPNAQEIINSIEKIKNNYRNYYLLAREACKKYFEVNEKAIKYSKLYKKNLYQQKIIPLPEWEKYLKLNNQELIHGNTNLKNFYQQKEVADNYVKNRFDKFPLNCLVKLEQDIIVEEICKFKEKSKIPNLKIMDFATGTARILKLVNDYGYCVGIDQSPNMLNVAASETKNFHLILADVFYPPIKPQQFDVIVSLRFLRHFSYNYRKKLYEILHTLLNDNGICIIDIPFKDNEICQRTLNGWDKYNVYDVFWTRDTMVRELKNNGFSIYKCFGIGENLPDYTSIFELARKLASSSQNQTSKFEAYAKFIFDYYYLLEKKKSEDSSQPLYWIVVLKKII